MKLPKIQKPTLPAVSKETKKRHLTFGGYSIGITALVIAIVVALNLIVGQLPEHLTNLDVSSDKIYEVSDTSKKILKNLDHDITFTVLAVKSETDNRIKTFINKYASLSDRIDVEWIDPVQHPSALTEYDAEQNTIVIACADTNKTTTVSFDDILVSDSYSYYYYGSSDPTEFDGDGQFTSAVNYVSGEGQHVIYTTTGHGEETFSDTISDLMTKNNYLVESVNTLTSEIPDDCELLIVNGITSDITTDEQTAFENYLAGGGKLMVLLGDVSGSDVPNLNAVLAEYNMQILDGYIADTGSCYQQNPYYIFPTLSLSDEDLSANMDTGMLLLFQVHGLSVNDDSDSTDSTESSASTDTSVNSDVSVQSFMTTTEQGYLVTDDAQEQGTYTIGAIAEKSSTDSSDDTTTARLTVFGTSSIINAEITDSFPSLENTTLFMNAVAANFDGVENVSIAAKSLSIEQNTMQHAGLFSLLVIFGIPLIILISGFVIWMKRRKR